MTVRGTVVLAMLAFAAFSGCTTGSAFVTSDSNKATDTEVQASPSMSPTSDSKAAAICAENGGWYDRVAGACDNGGM